MKNKMVSFLVLALLSFWIPCASAEISQELDPMVSPDAQAAVTSDAPANSATAGTTSNVVSPNVAAKEEKKTEETKKEKSKKADKKKAAEKKKKTSTKSSKSTKKSKKSKKSSL